MILGLPWTAWLLLVIAILPAPVMALAFFRVHRDDEESVAGATMEE